MITMKKLTVSIPNVMLDEQEVLKSMLQNLNIPYGAYEKEDGNLYIKEDTSYHGSPSYEEVLCTSDEKRIQKYKCLKELIQLYK